MIYKWLHFLSIFNFIDSMEDHGWLYIWISLCGSTVSKEDYISEYYISICCLFRRLFIWIALSLLSLWLIIYLNIFISTVSIANYIFEYLYLYYLYDWWYIWIFMFLLSVRKIIYREYLYFYCLYTDKEDYIFEYLYLYYLYGLIIYLNKYFSIISMTDDISEYLFLYCLYDWWYIWKSMNEGLRISPAELENG